MIYLGDFAAGSTIYIPFQTFNSSGASVTITGLAVTDIEIYKNGSTTQRSSDAGYVLLDTDGIDFDGITGIHGVSIDTSDNTDAGFFASAKDYWVVISSITVDSQTVNFMPVIFSIENRSGLRPTTSGRTLDVSAGGEAGVDWANVGSPTTSLALTGTTIATTQKVDVETIKTNAVANGGTVTFPTNATLASTTNITAGTVTTATNVTALTAAQTELASVPTTTDSLQKQLQFLFEYFRNKRTVTATTETLFKEDASTSLGTSTISDDGTVFTHGEVA